MKRAQIIFSLILLTVLSTPLAPVKADTTVGTQKSAFSMDIAADNPSVVLSTPLPSFVFENKKAFDLRTQNLSGIAMSGDPSPSAVTVTDYTGTNQGWQLSLAVSTFTPSDNSSATPISGTIHFHWNKIDTTVDIDNPATVLPSTDSGAATTDPVMSIATGSSAILWDTTASASTLPSPTATGQGKNTMTFNNKTTLDLIKNSSVKPNITYKSDLTWTLSNTPTN
ncbi:WxL domain-containing protein [Lacticaseibacillus saniviri]